MEILNKTENFYIKHFQESNNEKSVRDVSYLFKIIKVFKEKSEFLYNDNESLIITELDDDYNFPELDENENIYSITDIHGDLTAFLFSLLKSKVVKYKENRPSIIYFDLKENIIVSDVEEYIQNTCNEVKSLIPIPNLEINPSFGGKFICTGDLLDRGLHTDSCFCLIYYLLNQDTHNKIEFVIGNHEDLILRNIRKLYNGNNFNLIRNSLFNLVRNNKIKFCSYSNKTIFSHTIFEKDYVVEGLYEIMGSKNLSENTKIKADSLVGKIENNIELGRNDVQNLSELLNLLFKNKIISFEQNKEQSICDSIFIKKINGIPEGLLWSLNFGSGQNILGLYQVVGHEQIADGPILGNGIIKSDVGQSSGINTVFFNNEYMSAYSNATLLNFKNNVCEVLQKVITIEYVEELSENLEFENRIKLTMKNGINKAMNDIDIRFGKYMYRYQND